MREFERDVDVGDLLYSERRPARKKMMKDDVRGYFL
jgi:hypothetical protein